MSELLNDCNGSVLCPTGEHVSGGVSLIPTNCAIDSEGPITNPRPGYQWNGTPTDVALSLNVQVNMLCCTDDPPPPSPSPTETATSTKADGSPSSPPPTTATASGTSTSTAQTTQSGAQLEAATLFGKTASQSVTIGGLDCLQGANVSVEKSADAAAPFFGNCFLNLDRAEGAKKSADEAARRGGKTPGELDLDSALLGGDYPQKILADFQKHYGITGEDALRKFLPLGGGRDALEEILLKKLKAEQVEKILDAASAKKDESLIDLGAGRKFGGSSALREKLKGSLKGDTAALPSHGHIAKKPNPDEALLDSLTPEPGVFDTELSIFDVVRAKYRGKWPLLLRERQKR